MDDAAIAQDVTLTVAAGTAAGISQFAERLLKTERGGKDRLFTKEWMAVHPERTFWLIAFARWMWCMIPPAMIFTSVISIIDTAGKIVAPWAVSNVYLLGCNYLGQKVCIVDVPPSSTPFPPCDSTARENWGKCYPPVAFAVNIIILVMFATVYAVIVMRSRRRFEQLRDSAELECLDVAMCLHINRALHSWRGRAAHYLAVALVFFLMVIILSVLNAWPAVSQQYSAFMFLIFSLVKVMETMGPVTDQISYAKWDEKRKRDPSCVRAPLHNPFVSVLTRPNNKVIYEELTFAFYDAPPPTAPVVRELT